MREWRAAWRGSIPARTTRCSRRLTSSRRSRSARASRSAAPRKSRGDSAGSTTRSLRALAEPLAKSGYGSYLLGLLEQLVKVTDGAPRRLAHRAGRVRRRARLLRRDVSGASVTARRRHRAAVRPGQSLAVAARRVARSASPDRAARKASSSASRAARSSTSRPTSIRARRRSAAGSA